MEIRTRSAIHNPSPEKLRDLAAAQETVRETEYGSLNVTTQVTARSKLSTFIATDDASGHTDPTITRSEYDALARAQVGIAMGPGTDVAIQSAGVTLVQGDLRAIARARDLSRATMRNIRQNLFFAFAYNAVGVPIAAGVLYPFFGILLSPMIAAAAMSLSSVSVISNALRLRRVRI